MNRILGILNLLGVFALVLVCAAQWRADSRLLSERDRLERIRLAQFSQITQQSATIRNQAADLEEFRHRVEIAGEELKSEHEKLIAAQREGERAAAERDQLAKALPQWVAAVTARDTLLKQAAEQIQKLAADRNEAIGRFNDLAAKYNALVKSAGK